MANPERLVSKPHIFKRQKVYSEDSKARIDTYGNDSELEYNNDRVSSGTEVEFQKEADNLYN